MNSLNRHCKALELDKILSMLGEYTSCADSREAALAITPESSLSGARRLMDQTSDAHRLLARFGGPSFGGLRNIDNALARAEAGSVLTPRELLDVGEVLRVVRAVNEWYVRQVSAETSLDGFFSGLIPNRFLEDRIASVVKSEDEIADNASPALADIRRKIKRQAASVRERLDNMIRSQTYRKCLQDAIVTQRNGRFVLPVKSEYRSEIGGLVHDTSGSGATVFIEPTGVVEANNEIKVLESKERDEIERILTALSAEVGSYRGPILSSYSCAVRLDLIFAKARLAYAMKASAPSLNDSGVIDLKKARHPLLHADTVVPVDIYLGDGFQVLVITGPNTGGKTVSIKTLGLLSLMAACGLMVPADETSQICIFEKVFADIGDEQSIEQSLSTFSSHMVNIVDILREADEGSLVLIDELGAGTDPVEGAALATAILERLHILGCRVAATTHYAELKAYALDTAGVENGSCEFDVQSLKPTYRLLIGVPGRSNAFAITERLGMDMQIVERAREFVSEESARFEDVVDSLERSRLAMERERADAERLSLAAKRALEDAERERERARKAAEREAELARSENRRIVEKTRREAAALHEEIEKLRKELAAGNGTAEMAARARRLMKQDLSALDALADPVTQALDDPDYQLPRELRPGDRVKIVGIGSDAEVVSAPDKKGMVEVRSGQIKTRVRLRDIRLIGGKKSESGRTTVRTVAESRATVAVNERCDLRGMNAEEAILELEKFVDNAVISGLSELTVIHGKGSGVLRAAVGQYLKNNRLVKSYRSGKYGEGENGVTIVTLK